LIEGIKGNGIKLSNKQFSEVYEAYKQLAKQMGFENVPEI